MKLGFVTSFASTGISHGLEAAGAKALTRGVGGAAFNAGMGAAFSAAQGGDPWLGAAGSLIGYLANQAQQQKRQQYAIIANDEHAVYSAGHNAVLIGNDKEGYTFISKEGRNGNDPRGGSSNNSSSGGAAERPVNLRYPSFKAFLADPQFKNYNRFVKIPMNNSSSVQSVMDQEARGYYNVLTDNCGQAVNRALQYGGATVQPHTVIPNAAFNEIIRSNKFIFKYERY